MTATRHFEDQIEIHAPIDVVWALTLGIESWPTFTPTVTEVRRLDHGPLRVGSRARIKQPRQRPARWTIRTLAPPTRFEWQTKMLGTTISAGHHLQPTERGCRQTLTIDLSGPGTRMVSRLAGGRIARSIAAENQAFKQRAENSLR